MKRIRRVLCLLLAFVLLVPSSIALAYGDTGYDLPDPGSLGGGTDSCPSLDYYGFRIFIFDTDDSSEEKSKANNKLFKEIGTDTYKTVATGSENLLSSKFEKAAKSTGIYLGIGPGYQVRKTDGSGWEHIKASQCISTSDFNTCPGISGYTNIAEKRNVQALDGYDAIFDGWRTYIKDHPKNGKQNIINWILEKGGNSDKASNWKAHPEKYETKVIVVEPLVKFYSPMDSNSYVAFTWQEAMAVQSKSSSWYTHTLGGLKGDGILDCSYLKRVNEDGITCYAENSMYTPSTTISTVFALGGWYEGYIFNPTDCITPAFSYNAGYSFYGHDPDGIPVPPNKNAVASNIAIVYDEDEGTQLYKALNYRENRDPERNIEGKLYCWNDNKDKDGNLIKFEEPNETPMKKSLGIPTKMALDEYNLTAYGVYTLKNTKDSTTITYHQFFNSLTPKNFKVSFGDKKVKNGDLNVGKTHGLTSVEYQDDIDKSTAPLVTSVNDNINDKTNDGEKITFKRSVDIDDTDNFDEKFDKDLRGRKAIYKTSTEQANALLNRAFDLKLEEEDFALTGGIKTTNSVGLAVEVFSKGINVNSKVITIKVDKEDNITSKVQDYTYANNQSVTHEEEPEDKIKIQRVIAIPNYNTSYTKKDKLLNTLKGKDRDDILDAFDNYFKNASPTINDKEARDDLSLGIGSVKKGNNWYGYTIFILKEEPLEVVKVSGEFELEDYKLNNVYPSIMQQIKDSAYFTTLASNYTLDITEYDRVYCSLCTSSWSSKDYQWSPDSYKLRIQEKSSSGKNITLDNKFRNNDNYTIFPGNQLMGTNFNSRSYIVNLRGYYESYDFHAIDYAFNQIRSQYGGDKRTISTISPQTIGETYAKRYLGLEYGQVANTKANTVLKRDSEALVGDKVTDTITFEGRHAKYYSNSLLGNGLSKYRKGSVRTHSFHRHKDYFKYWDGTKYVQDYTWDECGPFNYIPSYRTVYSNGSGLTPFNVGGSLSREFKMSLNSLARKYTTKAMDVGENNVTEGRSNLRKQNGSGIDKIGNQNGYSIGLTKNSDRVLTFNPEVEMLAYTYNKQNLTSSSDVTTHTVKTMGEQLRSFNSSSLYIISVKTGDKKVDLQGTVTSDTFLGGTGSNRNNLPTLVAGGDFTLSTKGPNFTINLYGWTVDLPNYSKDKNGFNCLDDTGIQTYDSVIYDKSDVYSIWGNDSTTSNDLFGDYKSWTQKVLKLENFGADTSLFVDGVNKKFTNMNTTIGKLTDYDSKENGVFPISIKNGEIVKNATYNSAIKQLAKDYDCSESEAEEVLVNSGILTNVINSMETAINDKNQSQADPTGRLGNVNHWYDETTTVVLRRYETTPVQLKNIITNDKLDYSTAPTDMNRNQVNRGSFYLDIYFTKDIELMTDMEIYKPSMKSDNKDSAESTGNILIKELHYDKADFNVTNEDTSGF